MGTHNEILEELEEVLEKNKDAEKGFEKAAKNAENSSLKRYFERKSKERRKFNLDLKNRMKSNFTDFDEDSSFTGTIHRAWMDVKSLFSANDDESMLEESIRGDKAAIDEYNDILEEDGIPADLKTLLSEQRDQIKRDIEKNKVLDNIED